MNNRSVIGIREPGSLVLVQSLLRQGIAVRIRVSGNSMRPLLKGGEVIEIAPLLGNRLQLGEIFFLYDRTGNPLVHRLIWRRLQNGRLHLLTKGDACAGFDGFSPADNVLGQVRRIIPETGPPISLNTPFQWFMASLIVSHTLIFHALRRLHLWLCGCGKIIVPPVE
ncbi:Signal peptidase I [Candidatus Electronema halotolerans]